MDERPFRTAWWLGLTFLSLSGLVFVLIVLVLHLDAIMIPVVMYGYVSLGSCSFLTGYSARMSRGLYLLPHLYSVVVVVLGLMLAMLVAEILFASIGFFATFGVFLIFLALGLLRKPEIK